MEVLFQNLLTIERNQVIMEVLPIPGYGMLGIFVVTGILIGAVTLLNKLSGKEQRIKEKEKMPRIPLCGISFTLS